MSEAGEVDPQVSVLWAPPTADDPVLDERLRLFSWATAPERHRYLAVLRAIDLARERFSLQVRPADVLDRLAETLPNRRDEPTPAALPAAEPADDRPPAEAVEALPPLEAVTDWLDSLARWGVLHQSFDTSRATTVAEFRRHRPVYQFTELGLRTFRVVEELLGATPAEAQLQRVALAAVVEDLQALAEANAVGDDERCFVLVDRVSASLARLSERAADFFVVVAALGVHVDADATRFMELKDLLLVHLQEFLTELQRTRPRVLAALDAVEATGVDVLIERLVSTDTAILRTPAEREILWRARWEGLVGWFRVDLTTVRPGVALGGAGSGAGTGPASQGGSSRPAPQRPMVERLDRGTTRAIADLVALLRRLGERAHQGESRATALERLARRFAATATLDDAHRLFDASFTLGGARHLSLLPDERGADPGPRASWFEADPVLVPHSIRSRGMEPSPGRPAPLPDDGPARRHVRERLARRLEAAEATTARLVEIDFAGDELDGAAFAALLELIDAALASGVPVLGRLRDAASGARSGVRLVATATPGQDTVVRTTGGCFTVHDCTVEIGREAELASAAAGTATP